MELRSAFGLFSTPARWTWLPASIRGSYAQFLRRASRIVPWSIPVNIPDLGRIELHPHDFVDSRLFSFRVWEPDISSFAQQQIRPGDVAIDIGANIGYYTLLFSRCVGPEGRVYSVEPCPPTLKRLRSTVAENRLDNVTVVPFGVSDRAERRTMARQRANPGANSFGEIDPNGLELRRLVDLIRDEDLAGVSFIKIDVEGMEKNVLSDIYSSIDLLSDELIIVCEVRLDESMNQTLSLFEQRGFRIFSLPNDYSMEYYASGIIMMPRLGIGADKLLDVAIVSPKRNIAHQ